MGVPGRVKGRRMFRRLVGRLRRAPIAARYGVFVLAA